MMTEKSGDRIWALFVDARENDVASIKSILRSKNLLSSTRKAARVGESTVAFPLSSAEGLQDLHDVELKLSDPELFARVHNECPYEKLLCGIKGLLRAKGLVLDDSLLAEVPKHWLRHGDLVLLPSTAFAHPFWQQLGQDLWRTCCDTLRCSRIACNGAVTPDGYRSPTAKLLLGEDGWVVHVDNRIRYTFDITRCMFSPGNVTEKLRIARFKCHGETVVDLYAGIGYFTLPFLVHAGADLVHACEWNPDAVEALQRNLHLNKVQDRCVVHFGDCREVCPAGVADRVNLGLIPSSESGWATACRALKPKGWMHVHENVPDDKKETRVRQVCAAMEQIFLQVRGTAWTVECLHVERVKSYAPHVHHVVMDLRCEQTLKDMS
ncbi:tRNA wybutosine-synthesizing protein 2 homolog [Ornithodoros turicata]|uniref:tRNA wybutosine-synthesizing protein 2 homolog n=1 Tax=Ornithodoros turicata TaxID=34597 RepID=UPI003138D9B8